VRLGVGVGRGARAEKEIGADAAEYYDEHGGCH
jgi:hypothetical protein